MEQKFGVVAGNTYIRVDVRAQLLFLKLKLDLESVRIEEAAGLVRIGEAAGEPPVVAGREGIRHRVTECQLERTPKPVATMARVTILGARVPACCCRCDQEHMASEAGGGVRASWFGAYQRQVGCRKDEETQMSCAH
jgi:hypothetical protein